MEITPNGRLFATQRTNALRLLLCLFFASQAVVAQQNPAVGTRKQGDPLEHLPANIEILTHFGERADISPDNKSIAFMAKSFGDAMTIDLKTRTIRCLTCNVPAAAFLRVMHLPNGDYLLTGPDHFEDATISRVRDSELWFLRNERGAKPIKLGQKISAGLAISKKTLKIAFTQEYRSESDPSRSTSELVVADLVISGDKPILTNQKKVYRLENQTCTLEAQDFYDNDRQLIFFCYNPAEKAAVMAIDLQTGQLTDQSKTTETHNEPEGIFANANYVTVESDRQVAWLGGKTGPGNIDIWKLKLDGTGKSMERLTHFNDYEGCKASNSVVSTDGKFMAFQSAKSSDPAGVGYGVLLYWFNK
jgi:hypothetical protein